MANTRGSGARTIGIAVAVLALVIVAFFAIPTLMTAGKVAADKNPAAAEQTTRDRDVAKSGNP